MPAIEPLCHLIGIKSKSLPKKKLMILEAILFARICKELMETFRTRYKEYFRLMNFTKQMENKMLDANFVRFIIEDVLQTKEYDLDGIAHYTNTPVDVIHEILQGINTNPSVDIFRRSIELHIQVKREFYSEIIKKIVPA